MDIKSLIERRNKTMVDAQALITKETITNADRSNFDRMIADSDVDTADIKRMQSVDKFNAEQRATGRPPRAGFGEDDRSDATIKAEKRAFREWFTTGQVSPENRSFIRMQGQEKRDLGAGAIATPITGGNVTVPAGFDPVLHDAVRSFGQLVGSVRQLVTSGGGPIQVATSSDTNHSLTVIGEAQPVSSVEPVFSGFTSNTDTLTSGIVKISEQLLQDSAFDLDSWIKETFTTRYLRGLTQMITLGNGSNIAALAATLGATTAAPGIISYQDLVALYGATDASVASSGSWLMSSSVRATLMGLISTTGQPILQTDPTTSQPFASLLGRPICISEYSPTIAAGNAPVMFGDLQSYTLRQAGGYSIKRLDQLFAQTFEIGYILYTRAGGYNVDPGHHPIKSLVMHA